MHQHSKPTRQYLMTANMLFRKPYAKEAELLRELAGGKQWRIDAVMDAIDAKKEWGVITAATVLKQAAVFGRKAAVERMCAAISGFEKKSALAGAFQMAVLHGRYRVADALVNAGADVNFLPADGTPSAMKLSVEENSRTKIEYLVKKGATAPRSVFENPAFARVIAAAEKNSRRKP